MTALVLRFRDASPVLWRWRGPAAMARPVYRQQPGSIATIVGPPGAPAPTSIGFGWPGPFAAGEDLGGAVISGSASVSADDSPARVDVAPTSDVTFVIRLNGLPWGEVLILAGETTGAITLDTEALADGDLVQFTAPAVADPTLSGLYVTLASAQPET